MTEQFIEQWLIKFMQEVREDLSKRLQRDFEDLRKFYEEGDWFNFDIFFEGVEATVKGYYLAGKICREDLNRIFEKYGIL